MLGFYVTRLGPLTQQLFLGTAFDDFLVREAAFQTGFRSDFDGQCPDADAPEPYIRWEQLRPIAYQLIKGKTLPRSFQIVFRLSNEKTAAFLQAIDSSYAPEDVAGLFLNLRYAHEQLSVTTGCLLTEFSLDRELELAWDKQITRFLEKVGVSE